ncbi:futalosine hydrolase [Paenibacillus sp. OV219]|uniref:futalosine hydrolase n=1 Tax=Paenibacillus sp. OV219 TaxID=1884377 RepID=UPI000B876843
MQLSEQGVHEGIALGRVLIVTAVDAERDAVLRGLRGDDRFDVIAAGVGPAAAAAGTAAQLAAAGARAEFAAKLAAAGAGAGDGLKAAEPDTAAKLAAAAGAGTEASEAGDDAELTAAARIGAEAATRAESQAYRLVISAGIAGGFPGRAPIGSLVVATDIIAADLGVETPDGFASVDELGFGSSLIAADARLASALVAKLGGEAGLPVSTGPVLTVTTATGTAATAAEHERRVPGATAEAMEGFGVATAAQHAGLPVLELRAISNAVGPRDRDAWRIGDALRALEQASTILTEVLSL